MFRSGLAWIGIVNLYRNIISDRHLYSPLLKGLGSVSCRVENRNKPGFSKPGEVR